jgi:uncharacterized protein YyaL (SSP411 family)
MIRANVVFHVVRQEERYLEEARRIAEASLVHWGREGGGIADGGRFAHLLVESWVELYRVGGDPRWRDAARTAVTHARENIRDPEGRYGHRWDRRVEGPVRQMMLLDQAAAARAFWVLADVKDDSPDSDPKTEKQP